MCRLTLNNKHQILGSRGERERLCLQNTFGDLLKTQLSPFSEDIVANVRKSSN